MTSHADDLRKQRIAAQIEKNQAAIALLCAWRMEDANVNAQEKAVRESEGKALEEGLAVSSFALNDCSEIVDTMDEAAEPNV